MERFGGSHGQNGKDSNLRQKLTFDGSLEIFFIKNELTKDFIVTMNLLLL